MFIDTNIIWKFVLSSLFMIPVIKNRKFSI